MDHYIVRIYQRSEQDPELVAGVVEEVEAEKSHPFRTLAELLDILRLKDRPDSPGRWGV